MADEKRGGFCASCQQQRVVFRQGTNHILHLILTLLTVGFWAIIWFGVAVKIGGWRCTECGSKKISSVR
jgi:hypothetical protein